MTSRDRMVVAVVVIAGVLAGFWFGMLGPKRQEAADLKAKVTAAQQRLDQARQTETSGIAARDRYAADYATVARLGKAVPGDDDVPSLVFQLESAAKRHNIDFRAVTLTQSGPAAAAPPPATAPAGSPAVASEASAATLPPGAAVGAAGLATMPFKFTFDGTFLGMQRFLRSIDRLTSVDSDGQGVSVTGRLLTIDGFSLTAGRKGLPQVKAQVSATAYLLPATEGLMAGATPQAPAAAIAQQPQQTSAAAAPPAPAPATATAQGAG